MPDTDSSGPATSAPNRVAIVLHYYATGPGQELHDWFKARGAAETLLIEHPFPFARRDYTRIERARAGEPPVDRRLRRRRWPMVLRYALDFLRTLRLVWATGTVYDAYVGNGSFDTLAGLVLARLGRVPRPQESVEVEGARLTVLRMEGTRIVQVRVERV